MRVYSKNHFTLYKLFSKILPKNGCWKRICDYFDKYMDKDVIDHLESLLMFSYYSFSIDNTRAKPVRILSITVPEAVPDL
jgi:hypothetical protein